MTRGGIAYPATLGSITKCIAPILRKQATDAKLAQDTRLADAEARHAAEAGARDAEIATLRAELEALRNPQPEDPAAMSDAEKAARIRERLGI
jgi:hypothetical protein